MRSAAGAVLIAGAFVAGSAWAQVQAKDAAASAPKPSQPEIFRGADLKLGRQLMEQHRCAACHASKFGGDGSAIYRPKGRINTPGLLRGMTEQCNTELNLGLFPEEVTAVAAALNLAHYRFTH